MPAIRLRSVVFPHPEGPRNVMNEPARTVNERESNIGFLVNENPRLFASMTDFDPMHPSFSHPDCTVGNGLSPFPLSSAHCRGALQVAGCHRRSGNSPCLDEGIAFIEGNVPNIAFPSNAIPWHPVERQQWPSVLRTRYAKALL